MSAALLVLNGEKPTLGLFIKTKNELDLLVAVDGGYNFFEENNVEPDFVLGDFDSLNLPKLSMDNRFIHLEDQNLTDMEKALDFLLEKKIKKVKILGGFGKRTDHFIYNLHLLKKYVNQFLLLELHSEDEVVFVAKDSFSLNGVKGQRISFFPIYGDVYNVVSEGLKFDIKHMNMSFGQLSSISNEFNTSLIRVVFENNPLLIVCETRAS